MDDKLVELEKQLSSEVERVWGHILLNGEPFLARAAIRAIEATRSSVTADDALRDDAEWLRSLLVAWPPGQETEGEARLERIASRLRSPSPDGEVTEEMIGEARFLCDRLDDFERGLEDERTAAEFSGHVSPSLARLKAMISARSGG